MHKTLEAHSLPIPPQLTGLLKHALGREGTGFDEAAFLQQLHYWTLSVATTGYLFGGVKWIYNSLHDWLTQFPWMSEYGLRKAIANLKKLGLIETAQHEISHYNRVMFYRINYERLEAFAGLTCNLFTPRCANSDPIDVRSVHTSYTETSSKNSFKEQPPIVVFEVEFDKEEVLQSCTTEDDVDLKEEVLFASESERLPASSSGDNLDHTGALFPELIDAVAQAIHPAPVTPALKKLVAQFPDRVQPALTYLNTQRSSIRNPAAYLFSAISQGWKVSTPGPIVPPGFGEWFDGARKQGWAIASMTIQGIHHTLHTVKGWIPTIQLMQEVPHPSAS